MSLLHNKSYVCGPLNRMRRDICVAIQKWPNMRYWIYFCLHVHLGIKKLIIKLSENDTFMPRVRSKYLDDGTKTIWRKMVVVMLKLNHKFFSWARWQWCTPRCQSLSIISQDNIIISLVGAYRATHRVKSIGANE